MRQLSLCMATRLFPMIVQKLPSAAHAMDRSHLLARSWQCSAMDTRWVGNKLLSDAHHEEPYTFVTVA